MIESTSSLFDAFAFLRSRAANGSFEAKFVELLTTAIEPVLKQMSFFAAADLFVVLQVIGEGCRDSDDTERKTYRGTVCSLLSWLPDWSEEINYPVCVARAAHLWNTMHFMCAEAWVAHETVLKQMRVDLLQLTQMCSAIIEFAHRADEQGTN